MTAPWWTDDTVTIWHANARELPLPDECVDIVVTSPPYFGLRSYQDGGEHYTGQLGDEPTPAEFVDTLIDCTREMVRVLKPSGSIWVNLGDKYARTGGIDRKERSGPGSGDVGNRKAGRLPQRAVGAPEKSLIGIPWRYAIRCVDELRLILRAEVIWSKPNGLPESVTDRVRRSHETWFHFTVRTRYFSAVDEVREAHEHPGRGMTPEQRRAEGRIGDRSTRGAREADRFAGDNSKAGNPLGKLPGSVWEIPTQPLKVPEHLGIDHFAAFPMEWPRRIIRGWSPSGICVECSEGRRPVTEGRAEPNARLACLTVDRAAMSGGTARSTLGRSAGEASRVIVGETCACPKPTAPTRPAVVLDPFSGTGTTGLVAAALGRRAHLVDLSEDYCRLARWRVTDPAERARALQVDKPPPEPDGIPSLLDLIDT